MAVNDTLTLGSWAELSEAASLVRFTVFVHEQGVPESEELDDLDSVCLHAVVMHDGQAVATARLCPDGRIGRMAVLKAFRGQGVGARVLQALITAARKRGQRETYLHAQNHALGFYARYGFVAEGPEFEEAGILHRSMRRID